MLVYLSEQRLCACRHELLKRANPVQTGCVVRRSLDIIIAVNLALSFCNSNFAKGISIVVFLSKSGEQSQGALVFLSQISNEDYVVNGGEGGDSVVIN